MLYINSKCFQIIIYVYYIYKIIYIVRCLNLKSSNLLNIFINTNIHTETVIKANGLCTFE